MYKVYAINFTPPFKKTFIKSFNTFEEAQKFVDSNGGVGYMISY